MDSNLENPQRNGGRVVPPLTIQLTILAVAVGTIVWLALAPSKRAPASTATANTNMSAAEHAYLGSIQVSNVTLSRSENFIHQEVTIVNGDVLNGGDQPISALRLSTDFRDEMNQTILREDRAVLTSPLPPGERRSFEISFDHVPASWNMQRPQVRAVYVSLPQK